MKISIIIPVYNTENYLKSCLDSVLDQSFTDFEVLLVDDGSKDASGVICDEYALKDSRVRVFHQANSGVSIARNLALLEACGEWICFVDSDDVILPDYLEDMVSAITEDVCLVMANISDYRMAGVIQEDIHLSGEPMARYILEHSVLNLSGPVAKLFNRNILLSNHISFPEDIRYGEDFVFFLKYLNCIEALTILKAINYNVSFRQGSLSTVLYSFDSEYQCFLTCLKELSLFSSRLSVSPAEHDRFVWSNKVSDMFLRCPKSLYAGTDQYSWKEKMEKLKTIPIEYYQYFGTWFRPQGFSSWCVSTMVKKRWFTLLLLTGRIFEFFKKMMV